MNSIPTALLLPPLPCGTAKMRELTPAAPQKSAAIPPVRAEAVRNIKTAAEKNKGQKKSSLLFTRSQQMRRPA